MPESTPATPETSQVVPAAAPVAAAPPSEQTPQDASRAALYEKYYAPTATPESEAPAPVAVAPVPVSTPTADPAMASMAAEIAALKQLLERAGAPDPAPVIPAADWFDLLQQGKRSEAEQALKAMVADGAQQQITQQAVAQALETIRVQERVNSINNDLRVQNPDLVPFERMIAMDAEVRFRQAASGIKNADDYVAAYTKVVNESTGEIRKMLQLARAAGKDEARTINREVIAASTLSPNSVVPPADRELAQNQTQDQSPDISAESYLAMRQRQNSGARGLSQ